MTFTPMPPKRDANLSSGTIIYQIDPLSFTPEGTLAAVASRLAWVAEMGFTHLQLWGEGPETTDRAGLSLFTEAARNLSLEVLEAGSEPPLVVDDRHYYETLREIVRDGESAERLPKAWMEARPLPSAQSFWVRYSDGPGLERSDVAFGEGGAAASAVLNFTLDGVPRVFNGQEIGDAEPCGRVAGAVIRWDVADFTASNFRAKPRRALYRRLCQLRKEKESLGAGEIQWVENSRRESVVTFLRTAGDEVVLVAVNLSNRNLEVSIDVPLMAFRSMDDLVGERPLRSRRGLGRPTFDLEAFGYFVGQSESNV